ncbi:MAG: hypothetical protein AUG50_00375 [Betaproteobacteria bacterium 13_1_20CM_3_63_8]|nr:MAG: hypothetical protein AUG50_00375 [Betaproteobacteria bacterium 13_1_20CM_3_63_8]
MQVDTDSEVTPEGSMVRVRLALEWEPLAANAEIERPFEIELDVVGIFDWDGEATGEYRQSWTDFNGPYLLWPYIRSYMTWITTTAGLPPLVLPTLAVPRTGVEEIDAAEFSPVDPRSTGH